MEDLLHRHLLLQQKGISLSSADALLDESPGQSKADASAVGRKLPGRAAATMRVPLHFRYQVCVCVCVCVCVRLSLPPVKLTPPPHHLHHSSCA